MNAVINSQGFEIISSGASKKNLKEIKALEVVFGSVKTTDKNEYGLHEITDQGATQEDYTLTRKGNIGVVDSTDLMKKAWDAWNRIFNFYDVIFSDIADELLRL